MILNELPSSGLVFAGSDTTRFVFKCLQIPDFNSVVPLHSSAITTVINLLAQYPEIQDSLRAEVQEAHQQYGQELDITNRTLAEKQEKITQLTEEIDESALSRHANGQ